MSVIYGPPSENVASLATIVATTEDADYPAENLADLNPGKPAKLAGTSGTFVFDFGAPQRIDLVALWHHNLDAGLSVLFQGNATDSWGTPSLSAAVTIPALAADGYPVCPFKDLTGVTGYTTAGFRFWRLVVVGTNSVPVAIGDLWLAEIKRTFDDAIDREAENVEDHPVIEHETDFEIPLVYDLGVRLRQLRATVIIDPTILRPALEAWYRDCHGRARASLFIPESSVNDALFVRFGAGGLTITDVAPSYASADLVLEEVGRGLPL